LFGRVIYHLTFFYNGCILKVIAAKPNQLRKVFWTASRGGFFYSQESRRSKTLFYNSNEAAGVKSPRVRLNKYSPQLSGQSMMAHREKEAGSEGESQRG